MLASGCWWQHGLIPSVGNNIQRWAGMDVTISLKKLVVGAVVEIVKIKTMGHLTMRFGQLTRGRCWLLGVGGRVA